MSETFCYNADPSEGNYTILNNTCIRDKRLSLKAKGLHTYFMSLPPNWNLYKSELVKHSRDGIDSVNSAIKELVELGYVEITEQKRSADGRFAGKAYGFHAKPINTDEDTRHGFPVTVKPLTDKPFTENPQLLTTNKLNTNKQKTKLFQYANTTRFAYNWALARDQENYKNGGKFISDGDLRKEFTQLKKTDDYAWLNNVSNNVTKQAIKDACEAYRDFFKGYTKFPRFKSKKHSVPNFIKTM